MAYFHDDSDSIRQLIRDAEDPDNPQHGTPDSVRESAKQELRDRGFSESEINYIRLNGELPDRWG